MRIPTVAILASALVGASVSLATCTRPEAGQARLKAAGGFGEPARAGWADGQEVFDADRSSAASGGRHIDESLYRITAITVEPQTLPSRFAPTGKGVIQVAIGYWNARGLRETWRRGPIRVSWTLSNSDGTAASPGTGERITGGEAVLDHPGTTFRIEFPRPEAATSYAVLDGTVSVPSGQRLPFREVVVRRSPWIL